MRKTHTDIKEKFEADEWRVCERTFSDITHRDRETIFALANGYIGVRGGFEEGFVGEDRYTDFDTMLNGVYTYFPYKHVWARPGYPARWHSITTQMNPYLSEIYADGECVVMREGKAENYERTLDMRDGLLTRTYEYITQSGKRLTLKFERFVSLADKHLCCQRVEISCDKDAKIKIAGKISKTLSTPRFRKDGRKNEKLFTTWQKFEEVGGVRMGLQKLKKSGFEVACAMNTSCTKGACTREESEIELRDVYEFTLAGGEKATYERFNAHTCNKDYADYTAVAADCVKAAGGKGFDGAYREHSRKWREFWDSADIELDGDPAIQQGIRYCIFMVNASCGKDGKTNISANGLMGIGYCGQTFWDTELFIQPMYNYTDPSVTKSLIEYRYMLLDKARERARQMDDSGALFAWNTINGEECGHVFEASTAQYHINCDVYYSIYRYYEATGDEDFLVNTCAEILFEISKCMAHRGAFVPLKGNKFCINVVCGPDEYTPVVDNNTYTNYLTRKQLYFTLEVAELLREKYPDKYRCLLAKCDVDDEEMNLWQRAADNMYIGYNKELDIFTQDDQFLYRDPVDIEWLAEHKYPLLFNLHPLNLWRYQVCKQADLVFLTYIFGNEFDDGMKKRIYDYYEPRTIHDSSLSSSIHSIVACDIGYYDQAYGYLKQACRMDLDNYNKNVGEGIHAACSGGAYQMLVNGYAGLRVYDGKLHFRPFVDAKWNSLSFRIKFRGCAVRVKAERSATSYTLEEGEEITVMHYGKPVTLRRGETESAANEIMP